MYKLEIKDLMLNDSNAQSQLICEDENGDYYSFSLSSDRARLVYLLLYQTYVSKNTIYELFLKFLETLSISVNSVVIEDTKNLNAYLMLKASNAEDLRMDLCIQDAFLIGLLAGVDFYVKKDVCFIDHVEFCWLDFVKRFLKQTY